ncbi:elongation factor Tu, putative (apicoplast) [Plasmodium yoelii]|uniref:Elongation factor Tu, apicoplast n=3 Tax=Plasmodium yoelii TaxID=5861 RepID=A0AAE9WZM9_PLAYO|nr:elongation factor Tu, putative [Plasmodium yoelii]EAA17373.1 translation elongation factor Tu [Plasmodium yoelii yoelii]WBY61400.1 elongation factor Tu [Plasmodium yoelii yoelii]CDU21033.1 elongation factor Tu, putative [Plasmodium yoelii]VTZ82054.1 elongation factor Tu, putative [Plasmodium yoelii]BAL70696.1 translation elongation factor Tu [Plasmodium yoelii]|eukprot:XP_022811186.1 elongation factor Tu, putative (apicoplast) [Plasmodium yoelii]
MNNKLFIRNKQHINLGTIGHVDHGKTTLTTAISYLLNLQGLSKKYSYSDIDSSPEEKIRGITINTTHIEYETLTKHCAHIDCPGHSDYIKNMIIGATQMDIAILVISIIDGIMPQTYEHLLLIKQIGIKNLIIFLNKEDLCNDEELIDFIKLEINELLTKYNFDLNNIHILTGSALNVIDIIQKNKNYEVIKSNIWIQKLNNLINIIDSIQIPIRNINDYFFMSIEDVFSITGRGTVVTGKIEQGCININNEVELLKFEKSSILTTVIGLEMFKKQLIQAQSGDNVGVLLRNVQKKDIKRGMILATPNKLKVYKLFTAEVYILTKDEGGRHKPFNIGYKPQFFIYTVDVTGEIKEIYLNNISQKVAIPGDKLTLTIELKHYIVLTLNMKFSIREGGKTIGAGIITNIIN